MIVDWRKMLVAPPIGLRLLANDIVSSGNRKPLFRFFDETLLRRPLLPNG